MTGHDKAASPVLTVRDALADRFTSMVPARIVLEVLGIDPDMSVETLRQQLDWGQVAVRDDDEWEPLHIILRSPTGSRMAASPMSDNTDSPGAS